VAPVSGGSFPHQLAALQLLTSCGYHPPLALGSSGGNLSIYLTMAAHWDPVGISRVAGSLSSEQLVQSWFPSLMSFVPSVAAGIFTGAAYRTSTRVHGIFENYFTPLTVVETEVWNGAVNRDTGAVSLFCNRRRENALIQGNYFHKRLFKSEELKYLNGDLKKICCSSLASSAVPLVFEAQNYEQQDYIDGGTKFASPLVPLQDELRMLGRSGGIHITYINGYNVEEDYSHSQIPVDIISSGVSVTGHVVRGFVLHDRMTACELVRNDCCDSLHYANVEFPNSIAEVMKLLPNTYSSMLEIYPRSESSLNYTSFTGNQVRKMIRESIPQLAGRLWWVGSAELFQEIPGMKYEETGEYGRRTTCER